MNFLAYSVRLVMNQDGCTGHHQIFDSASPGKAVSSSLRWLASMPAPA